jgi:MOSC domain-containing protein YiiM
MGPIYCEQDQPRVVAVCADSRHRFQKPAVLAIELMEGLGVAGDAHVGTTVQHLYDKRRHPERANLRQVHLIASELFAELAGVGFSIHPGDLGENITTAGVDLTALPLGTRIRLGNEAEIELTGLRNPCRQIDEFQPGLVQAAKDRAENGAVILRAAVMAVVVRSGQVLGGDRISIQLPKEPHLPLQPV